MPLKGRKQKLDPQQNEVALALDALRSNPSLSSIKKPRNANEATTQSIKTTKKVSITKNNINPIDIDDIDDNIQNSSHEINESPSRLPLSESFTNTLENLSVGDENVSNEESKTIKLILETAKQILTQNDSIIEKQESLETLITQYEHFELAMCVFRAVQGIKNAIDNWLYPNDKIYKQAIRKELEALRPDKMSCTESCKYRGALFGSFRRAIFDHVFKKKVSPTVNSESSESEIISWKANEEVQ
ncbi:hypothetical protein F8M41_019059 [Gigaspora margarita]|uniref:Uncharacterized protein n=1 Tax=Gigaspora margarita TaxID=4874 RepID=A0A8H4AKM3_GIGMA|nr:hypothetical protein F8M41_019059 [Gigaspora margarita]